MPKQISWSAGTVLFEMVAGRPPLFWKGPSRFAAEHPAEGFTFTEGCYCFRECLDVLQKLLRRDPLKRCAFEDFF